MPQNLITVAKVSRRLLRRLGTSKSVSALAETLRSACGTAEVLYFNQYFDPWLFGEHFNLSRIHGVSAFRSLEAYHAPITPSLIKRVRKAIKGPFQYEEQRWFAERLAEALDFQRQFSRHCMLVVARDALAVSFDDREIATRLARHRKGNRRQHGP